jgi:hypothetical protein
MSTTQDNFLCGAESHVAQTNETVGKGCGKEGRESHTRFRTDLKGCRSEAMCCKLRPSNRQYNLMNRIAEWVVQLSNRLFKLTMRTLGPVMFVAANVLAGLVILILVFVLTPPLMDRSMFLYIVNLGFIIWGSVNIYFNYWTCMLTPPGAPELCNDPVSVFGNTVVLKDGVKTFKPVYSKRVAPNVEYRYCQHCPCIKPPRAHHCRSAGSFLL